ncbi:MAG: hypothetical protein GEV12_14415 [Micromonosporaceae bacterium]|nr:hypothetical protein [Micromonosporaceae bacterium]
MTEHNQGPAYTPPTAPVPGAIYGHPQPTPYGQPAAPQQPAKKKAPGWLVAVVAGLFGLCGIGAVAAIATSDDEPVGSTAPVETGDAPAAPAADKPEPPAAPEPDGTTSGSCDLLLFTGPNDQSEFAASVDVENTGNIGIKVKVIVSFDQLGRDDYVLKDTVKVKPGDVESVNLSEFITHDEVARHQDGGYECRIDGELVDTFGEVQARS